MNNKAKDMNRRKTMIIQQGTSSSLQNKDLTNYGQNKSRNNNQDMGLLAKCGCKMCTTIIY
jgi:hypothetical protein